MSDLKKIFNVKGNDFTRAGEASVSIKNILKSVGLDPKLIRRIGICGYEGEMNMVMHGGDGTLSIEINTDKIILYLADNGPGIENTELAMKEGYSTAKDEFREMGFGAGMGLPNMKKNSDHFAIESKVGRGTQVKMVFSLNP
ncbi:MAG: ATP-binding protein [Desulfobacterales bacterium]|nr:ATP-binding protein [Desulfobacterales bacterium]